MPDLGNEAEKSFERGFEGREQATESRGGGGGGEQRDRIGQTGALQGATYSSQVAARGYDPYQTASTGQVGAVTQRAIERGTPPSQAEISAALQYDVNTSLGFSPAEFAPPRVGPAAFLAGLQAFLGGPIGMFRSALMGGLGPITGQGVPFERRSTETGGGVERRGYGPNDFGTQPGSPSGSSAGVPGGASYFGRSPIGGVVAPQAVVDLSGLPLESQQASSRRTLPWWMWLLLLAAAAIAGYYIYKYYRKKHRAAA